MSLRLRVALFMALGIALALLLQGVLGYLTFTRLVLKDMDRDLDDFTRRTIQAVSHSDELTQVNVFKEGYLAHARLMKDNHEFYKLTSFPPELQNAAFSSGIHTLGAWRTTQVPLQWQGQTLLLQTALTSPEFTSGLRNHRDTMLFTALVVTLLGASVAYLLSVYALRPLHNLTTTSRRIAESGSLDQRVPEKARGSGEIHDLEVAMNRMLQRLAEFRSREVTFNRQAAHELRTPLAAMRLTLDAAQSGYADQDETLEAMNQELRRMERLTSSLLILSREGRLAQTEAVNLAALARQCAQHAGAHYQGLDAAWVQGDDILLRRALENLLENAARHAAGSPVIVSVQPHGTMLEVQVQDHGPGLPEQQVKELNEGHTRTIRSKTSGAGLGLSVVRHIMTAHQGTLSFEAMQPQGLRVSLRFPPEQPET